MSKNKSNSVETKILRANPGTTVEQAAVLAMLEYEGLVRLVDAIGIADLVGERVYVFEFLGLQLPICDDTTADGLIKQVRERYTELAALYARAPADAIDRTHSGVPGDYIDTAIDRAIMAAQMEGNECSRISPAMLASTRHLFTFNGYTVPFNPWAGDEAARVKEAVLAEMEAASKAYRESDEYKARQAADEAERQTLQNKVPMLMTHLPTVLKGPIAGVMEWVVDFATCHDRVGVETTPDAVVAAFTAEGYQAGAYVGPEYKEQLEADKEKFGRYIIGQFLSLLPKSKGMPNALWYFADKFRAMPDQLPA